MGAGFHRGSSPTHIFPNFPIDRVTKIRCRCGAEYWPKQKWIHEECGWPGWDASNKAWSASNSDLCVQAEEKVPYEVGVDGAQGVPSVPAGCSAVDHGYLAVRGEPRLGKRQQGFGYGGTGAGGRGGDSVSPSGEEKALEGGHARNKQRWSREAYNAYQREYMRKRRAK